MKPGAWLAKPAQTAATAAHRTGYTSTLAWSSDGPVGPAAPASVAKRPREAGEPTVEELTYWWACLRKVRFLDAAVAEQVLRAKQAESYDASHSHHGHEVFKCEYGDHYHTGRRSGHGGKSKSMGPAKLLKHWRWKQDKPSPEALRAAFRGQEAGLVKLWGDVEGQTCEV